jgi:hypothetical protein
MMTTWKSVLRAIDAALGDVDRDFMVTYPRTDESSLRSVKSKYLASLAQGLSRRRHVRDTRPRGPSRARSDPKYQTEHQTEEEIEGGEPVVESLNRQPCFMYIFGCSASLM